MKKGHTEATYEFPINAMLLKCALKARTPTFFLYLGENHRENARELCEAIRNGSIDIDSHHLIYVMTSSVSFILRDFVSEATTEKDTEEDTEEETLTEEEDMFRTWVFNKHGVHPYGSQWCSYYKWNEKATKFEIKAFCRAKIKEEFDGKLDNVVFLDSFFIH